MGELVPAALLLQDRTTTPSSSDEGTNVRIQVEPPGPQRLFRLESEAQLFKRIQQEGLERTPPERISFPAETVISLQSYDPSLRAATWPPLYSVVEPHYVCYGNLLFEQRNAERYGWDLGPLHPVISAGVFVADAIKLPASLAMYPFRKYDCSAGLCLPGDPVPLLIYPPDITATGVLGEVAVVAALVAIF